MATLEQRFKDFSDKVSSKLNQLKTDLSEVIPWKGLSPNNGQSLTTDTEGKVYFKERTPEEIAQAYESLTDRNRFSNAHKETVESFEGQFLQFGENVKYTPQNLTPSQKQQAQSNIGVDEFQNPLTAYQNALTS